MLEIKNIPKIERDDDNFLELIKQKHNNIKNEIQKLRADEKDKV